MTKERLETFSDGVFAIVLTLLVLGLVAPQVPAHSSLSQYAVAMAPVIPHAVAFAVTFVTICIHWVNHHYFFSDMHHVTIGLVWLNNLFLLWMCFLPFPTSLLGEHPTDQFPILLYAANSLLAALTFYGLRSYAERAKLFTDHEVAEAQGPRHSIPAVALFSLSILLAIVNVYLSLTCFLLVPVLYFLPNLIRGRKE